MLDEDSGCGREKGMGIAVSVIVPICNVERYLQQCLASLAKQRLKDIEVICLDDGSTDGSGVLLDRLAPSLGNAIVVHKPNSGYGATMNQGIDMARGEYVGILESDDFVSPAMYRDCYRVAKRHGLDMVRTNYSEFCAGRLKRIGNYSGYPYHRVFDPVAYPEILGTTPSIWAGLYRRAMLEEQGIRFVESPGASFQDTGFSYKTWIAARRVMLLRPGYVRYRVDNADSSVKSQSKVFALCEEFRSIDGFLAGQPPERAAVFARAMQQARFGNYRWNYNRIAEGERPAFVAAIADEFKGAQAEGLLDKAFFEPGSWMLMEQLLALEPEEFCTRYAELPWDL